jgi:hypothetical protein
MRVVALALLVSVTAGPAFAQDKAVVERLNELDRQAIADYAAADFESARLGLREAITLAGKSGLAADPVMAKLWADLGALYINGLKDKPKGGKALGMALKIDPRAQPSEPMMTPEVKAALAAAAGAAAPPAAPAGAALPAAPPGAVAAPAPPGAPPAAAPAGAAAVAGADLTATAAEPVPPPPPPKPKRKRNTGTEPDLPANIPQPLYCPNMDEAPPEENVVFYCVLSPELEARTEVKKVTLFYRSGGAERWTSATTRRSELGWWKAVLPGDAVTGKSVQFYLDAKDPAGKSVGHAGRDDSPNQLFVREGAPSLSGGVWAGMQAARRDGDDSASQEEDPLEAVARQREEERFAAGIHRRGKGAFFMGVSFGSGYGWHPRGKLEFYEDATIEAGFIPSGLLYVQPFLGYQVTESIAVGAEARLQYIPQTGSGDPKAGAPAAGAALVLGRLQYLFGRGNLQGTVSLLGGVGDFRLTIGPQTQVKAAYLRNDSVRGGPLVAGGGLGFIYHFSPHLGLVVDGRGLLGGGNLAAVFDLSGGLAIAF